MTHVIAFATRATSTGGPTALLPLGSGTVIESLVTKLRTLPVDGITVVSRPQWADDLRARGLDVIESADIATDVTVIAKVVQDTAGAVVLTAADLVAHRRALVKIAGVRPTRTVAAVGHPPPEDVTAQPVLRQRDQVISVGTMAHDVTGPNIDARGIVAVAEADRHRLLDACAALDEYGRTRSLDAAAGPYEAIGLVLLALVRGGVPVGAYHVRFLSLTRVGSVSEVLAADTAMAWTDEDRAALLASRKEDEEFLATYIVQSYSIYLVRFFARCRFTPNAVTWASIAVAAAATGAFATGERGWWVLGAVLLYASFVLDCCDGGLARYAGGSTRYGGWFDMFSDRIKEYGVYAGLAVGGVRAGETGMWPLAIAALSLMTIRHMVDTFYGALQETATRALPEVPLTSRLDRLGLRAAATSDAGDGTAAHVGTRLGQLSASVHGHYRSPAYWLKRSLVLPIGDRWLVIAVVVALAGPKAALIVLLAGMTVAFAYVCAGRVLRTVAMRVSVLPRFDVPLMRDDGLIARTLAGNLPPLAAAAPAIGLGLLALRYASDGWAVPALAAVALGAALGGAAPHDRPLDWLVPAALRAVEITFYLVAGRYAHVPPPLVYALIAVVVLVHYEISSRTEKAATPMGSLRAALGWDGRIVTIAVATVIGHATAGFALVTAVVAATLTVECAAGLLRRDTGDRRGRPDIAAARRT
jgi:phosphatidylglycerophosphate synthase